MPKVKQLDTSRSDLLEIFSDLFEDYFPFGAEVSPGYDYDTSWSFRVANGVGILKVTLEDVNTLNSEDFEWELNLKE